MDKFIKFMENVWAKCKGNRCKQAALVFLVILAVTAIAIAIYFYLWLIVFVLSGVAYLVIDKSERKKAQTRLLQKVENVLPKSIVYILNEVLTGLEHLFGILNTPDKGFCGIKRECFNNGVWYYVAFYLRLPDLPDFESCEQLRAILNNRIQSITENLIYYNTELVWLYVLKVKAKKGKLAISVIPLIDAKSNSVAKRHRRWIEENELIGKTKDNVTDRADNGDLEDEEL